jgi:hypothetical protein
MGGSASQEQKEAGLVAALLSTLARFGAALLNSSVIVLICTGLLFPIELVRKSGGYKRSRTRWPAPIAFCEALAIDPPELGAEAAEQFVKHLLLFAPRVSFKLAAYGMVVRGMSAPYRPYAKAYGTTAIVAGAIAAALAQLLYAFPFKRIEHDEAVRQGSAHGLAGRMKELVRFEGVWRLYHGVTAAVPYAVAHSLVLFLSLETIADNDRLVERVPNGVLRSFIASFAAVILAAVMAAPLEQLRQIMVAHPFDYNHFLHPPGSSKIDPDMRMLGDYVVHTMRRWTRGGPLRMMGQVNLQVNSVELALALALHHLSLGAR